MLPAERASVVVVGGGDGDDGGGYVLPTFPIGASLIRRSARLLAAGEGDCDSIE